MAFLQLQVNSWLQRSALEVAEVSAMVAAKLRSPLVSGPRYPKGQHPQETICFSPQAAHSNIPAIMVQLLEGRIIEPTYFAFLDVCTVTQYLLIAEDYLMAYLLPYMTDKETCKSSTTFNGIERV